MILLFVASIHALLSSKRMVLRMCSRLAPPSPRRSMHEFLFRAEAASQPGVPAANHRAAAI